MKDEYIFVTDINSAPCVSARKTQILKEYSFLDRDRIKIVRREIESWYLAGLDAKACKQLKLRSPSTTDNVTKEQFEQLKPTRFDSRKDFMVEILRLFSIDVAKEKNSSFQYFAEKHDC